LWGQLKVKRLQIALGRFMNFCSLRGISPEAVSDRTIGNFAEALVAASLHKKSHITLYHLTTGWNTASQRIPGWPSTTLTVPRRRVVLAIPADELPPSFRQDLDLYLAIMRAADPLSTCAPLAR
jgi:hypothetical protein